MGSHGVTSARQRASKTKNSADKSTNFNFPNSPAALRDLPVSWRLLTVIAMALLMGLVFGGLRVASAVESAESFGRVSQLASLGQQVTVLVQDLQNERDETTGLIPIGDTTTADKTLQPLYNTTNAQVTVVKGLASGIDGSFPVDIQSRAAAMLADISNLGTLRGTVQVSDSPLAAITGYAAPVDDMLSLTGLISEGTSDSQLTSDVQTLSALSQAKDEASQQRALLFNGFRSGTFVDGVQQGIATAESEQAADLTAFTTNATPAEQADYTSSVAGSQVNLSEDIEQYVVSTSTPSISGGGFTVKAQQAPAAWYQSMSATVNDMQSVELTVAGNIVARAHSLQGDAEASALLTAIVTIVVLLIVALATLLVARSLVLPLRRLRAGALDIAAVQLPDRVRRLGEALDPAASLEVTPIDVASADEIGQVARAFDQVHSEAVRLAGNEAMMRNSFNAMFVNLSRRSQVLIEQLARMIDSLEQSEEDPDRLSNLFSMDHLVTRMRRNSENLLLLAGHEGARKWAESVPLADVARAATSEIEQYGRVTLNIQPGVAVSGQAVSDVVHLLAELVENATTFSPKDTAVQATAQELTSGGVLIEVSDRGVGISETRLEEMNWRLDNPPVMDVSVSRHMGLFAVGRLAQRHGVRVRLRPGAPGGLTALVWLPESVIERTGNTMSGWAQPTGQQARQLSGAGTGRRTGAQSLPGGGSKGMSRNGRPAPDGVPAQPSGSNGARRSVWFRSQRPKDGSPSGQNGQNGQGIQAGQGGGGHVGQGGGGQAGLTAGHPSFPSRPSAAGLSSPTVVGTPANTWAEAAQIAADPVQGDQTSAGLPLRVPRANLLPGTAHGGSGGTGMSGGTSANGGNGDSQPMTNDSYQAQLPAGSRQRTPEMARNRLSGFQRGARRAQGDRPEGEGADR